ncbi:DUF6636 domain-containing protein [Yoonia maricola]|nr:DUF6636 domain-containing protein [Yoonia maricola]
MICAFLLGVASNAAWAVDISFQSPSGNIRCDMSRDAPLAVRCDLGVERQSYTNRPESCDGVWGTSFGLGQTGTAQLICVTGADLTSEGRAVLPYGSRAILDGITCRSEPSGVICVNIAGNGFEVRRAQQRMF